MAITITELTEYVTSDNTSTYTTSGTYTPAANKVAIALCSASGTVSTTQTGTGNGQTWSIAGRDTQSTADAAVFWELFGGSPTTTGFTYTTTGDAGTGAGIWVAQLDGVDTTAPVTQCVFNSGASTAPTWTLSATAADSAIIVFFHTFVSNPAGATPPSAGGGYTEAMDNGFASPTTGMAVAYHLSPGSVTSVTFGNSYANWRGYAIEIKAEATGNITGVAFTTTPTLPAGKLNTNVTGVALTTTPTLPAGSLRTSVTGVALTTTPTLPAGSLSTGEGIEFVGSDIGAQGNGVDASINLPATTQEGDFVLVVGFVSTDTSPGDINMVLDAGSGFTERRDDTREAASSYVANLGVWHKFAGPSDANELVTVNSTGISTDGCIAACMVFRGVDSTTPFDVADVKVDGEGTTVNWSAINWSSAGTWTVAAAGWTHDSASAITGQSGDYSSTMIEEVVPETFGALFGMAYSDTPADPEDPSSWVVDVGSGDEAFIGVLMALRKGVGVTEVDGVVLTTTPTLPAGSLRTSVTGAALTTSPSLPAGALRTSVTGVVLTSTPTLPAGSLRTSVTGVVLTTTPTLPAGSLRTSVTGVVLTTTPTLPAGALDVGADQVIGVVLETTPTLPAGSLSTSLTGVVLTTTPTLPAGSLRTSVTGVVITTTPTLPAGSLHTSVTGIVLTTTPTLPAGTVSGVIAPQTVTGVTLETTPIAYVIGGGARVMVHPVGVVLVTTITMPAGSVIGGLLQQPGNLPPSSDPTIIRRPSFGPTPPIVSR